MLGTVSNSEKVNSSMKGDVLYYFILMTWASMYFDVKENPRKTCRLWESVIFNSHFFHYFEIEQKALLWHPKSPSQCGSTISSNVEAYFCFPCHQPNSILPTSPDISQITSSFKPWCVFLLCLITSLDCLIVSENLLEVRVFAHWLLYPECSVVNIPNAESLMHQSI